MATKLDAASLQVLCDATKLSNPETNNLEHCVNNDQISLCVWGNLTKNPRFECLQDTFYYPKLYYYLKWSLNINTSNNFIFLYPSLSIKSKAESG